MFGSKQREIDRLKEGLDEERKRDHRTHKSLMECFEKRQENVQRFAKERMEWAAMIEKAQAERDELKVELNKMERQRDEARSLMYDAQHDARRREMEVERLERLLTLEPKQYVVIARDGTKDRVTADDHVIEEKKYSDEDCSVLNLYLKGELVARYPEYVRFKIEPDE